MYEMNVEKIIYEQNGTIEKELTKDSNNTTKYSIPK